MPVNIIAPGTGYWDWAGYSPIETEGLIYAGLPGGTVARSQINWTPGAPNAEVVGEVLIETNHVRTRSRYAYIDTKRVAPDRFTVIAVHAPVLEMVGVTQAGAYDIVADLGATAGGGFALYSHSLGVDLYVRMDGSVGSSARIAWTLLPGGVSGTGWALHSGRYNGERIQVIDRVNGIERSVAVTPPGSGRIQPGVSVLVGSGNSGNTRTGTAKIGPVLIWGRALSDQQIDAEVAALRAIAEARGITF